MSKDGWEKFYNENPPPSGLHNIQEQMKNFCNYHALKGNCVVLVTSGGTTVPLEHNTVRFVDNFSAGTRGAASAEYFLKSGCAVIFMHRTKSLEPFVRHVSVSDLLDSLQPYESSENSWKLEVQGSICNKLIQLTKDYKDILTKNMLLKIQFTTLSSYLHLLFVAAHAMKNLGKDAIFYLAAAVSDFYIPEQEMATHKISSDEPISLTLQLVPKVLQPLVRYWVPEAFIVSFKLETDESILVQKAKRALSRYGHKLVIGNELNSRKEKVIFVTEELERPIVISKEDVEKGNEIEELIIKELLNDYKKFKNCS